MLRLCLLWIPPFAGGWSQSQSSVTPELEEEFSHYEQFSRMKRYVATMERFFHNLERRKALRKTYADGIVGVTVQRFKDYAVQVLTIGDAFTAATESLNGKPSICIAPTPFCVGGIINDARYVDGDVELEDWKNDRLTRPQEVNCMLKSNERGINSPSKL